MKFRELIPHTGWIRKYVCYAAGAYDNELPKKFLNEIPFEFHLFTGLTILAAALRRNVFLNQGVYEIWPPMLTFIIAPSGSGKKTTAIKIGMDILIDTGITNVLSERMTPEALIVSLKRERPIIKQNEDEKMIIAPEVLDSTALIVAPELSTFFNKAEHNQYMFPLLTRFADCPKHWTDHTISRGYHELHNVAVTLLGASAPAWLLDGAIPRVAFGGGFMARGIIIVRMKRTGPVPRPQQLCQDARDELTQELIQIGNLNLEMTLDNEAREYFDSWYMESYYKRSYEEKRAAYHERKPDHILRIAMIIAVSKLKTQISRADLIEGINIVNELENGMFDLFGTIERSSTTAGFAVEKVLQKIKHRGRIQHSDLMRSVVSVGLFRDDVAAAIDMLEQAKIIKIEEDEKLGKRKSKLVFYRYLGGENDESWTEEKQLKAEEREDENSH